MSERRVQILSLSGGGYRGLYTAAVLAELEKHVKRPLGQCFDLIAGTSIGGILAMAVAFEVELERVVQVFIDEGPNIFPQRSNNTWLQRFYNLISDVRRPPYRQEPIRHVIRQLLDDAILGDAKHPLIIPAVNLTEGRLQIFKTRHHNNFDRDWRLSVADVGVATSAAPTFFPPARIDNCLYADGGLFANSPDIVGLHEATHFLKCEPANIFMLSVGTTTTEYSIPDTDANKYGTKFWVVDGEHRLPNVFISAAQQFAEQIALHNLGARYRRIDTLPSHEQAPYLGLDIVTPVATKTLMELGKKAGTDALGEEKVQALLKHVANNFLLPREEK